MQISQSPSFQSLDQATSTQSTQQQRLGSGQRINSAKDDAAGLSISNRMDTQSRSMTAAVRNTMDGVSRIQVEDGALGSISEDFQRIRELGVQQQNGTLNESDKRAIQSEIDQRLDSINSQFEQTQFNGRNVFEQEDQSFQVDANAGDQITLKGTGVADTLNQFGVEAGSEIDLDAIDQALESVNDRRVELGAVSNRLSASADFVALKNQNNQEASSRIRDTDYAQAASEKSKADIQRQVSISVTAQGNANRQDVLKLLG
ncbi:flagellin Hag [Oceaniserpentilla sp. 4NH20-0058]|uniref:flagellin N-terminal helical domain-containing protein n=1 Tax=Oceaniserpentilla sp. 4NH20-0058 TaxID=3127660 RepID=UPI00310B366E